MKSQGISAEGCQDGKQPRERVLEAATRVLIEGGYQSLSMRKVAEAAEMKLGTLQNHFPTKDMLVEAMLDRAISGYLQDFDRLRRKGGPEEQFRAIIEEVFTDLNTRETTVFFPELWSLSNHDESASRLMHEMYGRYRQILCEVISNINPALSARQVERLALFISCSVEGHTTFVGHAHPWREETGHIIDIAIQGFLWLIRHGEVPDAGLRLGR